MKAKPRGARYRNLFLRAGAIYYEREVGGVRIKRSTRCADWETAAAFRDLYEERKGIAPGAVPRADPPRFDELARRYLDEATGNLAGSTREDRTKLLRPGGMVARAFTGLRVDAITKPVLLDWWQREVEGRGRSPRTGLTYLSALAAVLSYGVDLELLADNPVDGLRGTLRRRRRTKRGRSEADRAAHVRPIESPAELARFVAASSKAYADRFPSSGNRRLHRWRGYVADLLMLDAGLRIGEVAGLRWRDVSPGRDATDPARCLEVRESRARGKHEGAPKSGRARRVALSLRLRRVLQEHRIACGNPKGEEHVIPGFHPRNYAARHFDQVVREAKLSAHTPKDLRDTFASQLLSAGVPVLYVSAQLGHADFAVTARHYTRWCGGNVYRPAPELRPGEVAADLLARLGAESHQSPTSGAAESGGA